MEKERVVAHRKGLEYGDSLNRLLQEVAERVPYSFRELEPGQYPTFKTFARIGPELENAWAFRDLNGVKSAISYGDTHGLMFRCLHEAVQRKIVSLPLRQVLNVDYHADIAPYTSHFVMHTANWQRYGVDKGFWSADTSYNWRPEHSDAEPVQTFSPDRYIRSVTTGEVKNLEPQVLSIDLDFFMGMKRDQKAFQEYLEILKKLECRASLVSVFSSSGWTAGQFEPEDFKFLVSSIHDQFYNRT